MAKSMMNVEGEGRCRLGDIEGVRRKVGVAVVCVGVVGCGGFACLITVGVGVSDSVSEKGPEEREVELGDDGGVGSGLFEAPVPRVAKGELVFRKGDCRGVGRRVFFKGFGTWPTWTSYSRRLDSVRGTLSCFSLSFCFSFSLVSFEGKGVLVDRVRRLHRARRMRQGGRELHSLERR
jgi:hypothetical protein